jgi:hypothetical protein
MCLTPAGAATVTFTGFAGDSVHDFEETLNNISVKENP